MKLVDLIVYPQLLEAAGYTVFSLNTIMPVSGGGVCVMGNLVRDNVIESHVLINASRAGERLVDIDDQLYVINLSADGSFWLGDHTEVSDADHETTR